jgi:hypothetical protein
MIMECLKSTELKREDEDIRMKTNDKYCNEPNDEFVNIRMVELDF